MLNQKALAAAVSTVPVYIEDVFGTYLFTGTGATQSVVNGIDLLGSGGLVWLKGRPTPGNHILFNTVRGANLFLKSNSTAAEADLSGNSPAFNSNGFSINNPYGTDATASWTFRKQAKFFDIVTWTGDGTGNRRISHSLGSTPGMIIVKCTSAAADWSATTPLGTWGAGARTLLLNTTDASGAAATYSNGFATDATTTDFKLTLNAGTNVNSNGQTYVAYLFAHNAGGFGTSGSDNVISCGSFNGTANTTVTLGYEPQWIMFKNTTSASNWQIVDNMRGMPVGSTDRQLIPNTTAAESDNDLVSPTATGFTWIPSAAGNTYIYVAIRRGPMKTPTSGTQVYSGTTWTGDDSDSRSFTSPGFPPDMLLAMIRGATSGIARGGFNVSRLVGTGSGVTTTLLDTTSTSAATTANPNAANTGQFASLNQNGFTVRYDLNRSYDGFSDPTTQVNWAFRRAPGFFDVVCYTGTGSATTVSHNLGVVPEMMIVKGRNNTLNWVVYHKNMPTPETAIIYLNDTSAKLTDSGTWNATNPTSTVFSVGTAQTVNQNTISFVAYLFATVAGVSKVGSYTGTGTTLQVDCGFTAGARFVLIKRSNSTGGDWYVWDSARGIVAGNDPYLLLNSTAAETTGTDYIDTYSAGFELSSTAPAAINASGGNFIFLAIA